MAVFVHCPQPLRLLLLLHRVLNLRQPLFTCRSARSVFLGVALPARALQRHREALLGEVLLPALLTPHNPCRDLTSAPEELVLFQFLLPLLCFFLFLSLLHPYSSPIVNIYEFSLSSSIVILLHLWSSSRAAMASAFSRSCRACRSLPSGQSISLRACRFEFRRRLDKLSSTAVKHGSHARRASAYHPTFRRDITPTKLSS